MVCRGDGYNDVPGKSSGHAVITDQWNARMLRIGMLVSPSIPASLCNEMLTPLSPTARSCDGYEGRIKETW